MARLAAEDSDNRTKDPLARGVIRTDDPRVAGLSCSLGAPAR
jgi:hypothetical protein